MSEEEIIEYVKEIIQDSKREINGKDYFEYIMTNNDIEAIQSLLDLYNKEKEKNKELFEEYNKRVATIIKYEQGINEIIDKIYEEYTDISEVVEDLEKLLKRE